MRLLLVWLMASTGAFAQFAFGVKGGVPLTDFYQAVSNPGSTFHSSSARFILGPTVELHLPAGFGLEADALYRHFNYTAATNLVDVVTNINTSNAWEFPLLVKYRSPGLFVRPFLDAGVAFDHWSGFKEITNVAGLTKSNVSGINTGFVAGAGIELKVPLIRISPEIRFTRWGATSISDLGGALRSNQNQVEVMVGITF